jgi:hypothetical protein
MNARILAATTAAGAYAGPCTTNCVGGRATRTPTNVTTEIEALLGTIPAACRDDTTTPPFEITTSFPSTSELDAFSGSGMGGWTTETGNGWTESGGVATPTSGSSRVNFDTTYGANQEAWAEFSTLHTDGGITFDIHFLIQDGNNRYRLQVSRVTGASNDTLKVTKLVGGSGSTVIGSVDLTFDVAVGDKFGVRVLDGTLSMYYHDASALASNEWYLVGTTTVSGLPSSSKLGLNAATGAVTSFGGGQIGGGSSTSTSTSTGDAPGERPRAPSRPLAPSRPVAPSRPIAI